jgi:hypothetical protein
MERWISQQVIESVNLNHWLPQLIHDVTGLEIDVTEHTERDSPGWVVRPAEVSAPDWSAS